MANIIAYARMSSASQPDRFGFLHIDLNSFFASVEQQLHPDYRNRPLAVVPTMADTTCCIAASYEAKALGIKTGTQEAIHMLTRAAVAHFRKHSCLVIVDRDGEHYDLALTRPDYEPTAEDETADEKYFGSLRMRSVNISHR